MADWLCQLAEAGVAESQYQLGLRKLAAAGEEDRREGFAWLLKAAESEHTLAQYEVGMSYVQGNGVESDDRAAVGWYRAAADSGHSGAQFCVGACYEEGTGIPRDLAESVRWYRKAAEQGDADAQYSLGRCCESGEGVSEDLAEAMRWYECAASQGDVDSQIRLAIILGDTGDEVGFLKWLCLAADQGSGGAEFLLAMAYASSSGDEASREFVRELESLHHSASDKTSLDIEMGTGGTLDLAAAKALVAAQFQLGEAYLQGQGTSRDTNEAASWYEKAAVRGHLGAQFQLGTLFADGARVPLDRIQAHQWLSRVQRARGRGQERELIEEARERLETLERSMSEDELDRALRTEQEESSRNR